MRIVIIGGGIIGCACALELSRRGAEVVVVERAELGAEASSVAAGILGAQVEGDDGESDDALMRRVRAREAYRAFSAELESHTGEPTGHRACGVLVLARTEARRDALARAVARDVKLGLRAELLDAAALGATESAVARAAFGAAFFPDDAQVEPPLLMRALAAALRERGVVVRRADARALERDTRGACIALETSDGKVSGDAFVACTGAFTKLFSASLGALEILPPVEPVRGQLVTLKEDAPSLSAIVFDEHGYVVPRGDGRLVCGSTMEHVGFARGPTAQGVHHVLEIAAAILPASRDAAFVAATSSFRPFLAGGPRVGATDVPRLFVATGHHRNGILLAKQTADDLAAIVLR
jgi:glycine oxidase